MASRRLGAALRCRAAAGDVGDDEDTQTVVLTGKLGQNVRQGMDGWNTRVQVQKVRSSNSGADSAPVAKLTASGGRWGRCTGLVRRTHPTALPQGARCTQAGWSRRVGTAATWRPPGVLSECGGGGRWQAAENDATQVAMEGDEVTVSFVVKTEAGEVHVRRLQEKTLGSVFPRCGRRTQLSELHIWRR
jgi:hypothetical protein